MPLIKLNETFSHRISRSPTSKDKILFKSAYICWKNSLLYGGLRKKDTFCSYNVSKKKQITVSQIVQFNYF